MRLLARAFQRRLQKRREGVDVFFMRAVIDDRRTDRRDAVENGERRGGLAALVQLHHDLAGERAVLVALDAKAHDVEHDRRAHDEMFGAQDPRLQPLRHAAGLLDALREALHAEGLDRNPGFQRPEPSRQIGAEIAGPHVSRRKAARRAGEIGGVRREGAPVRLLVPHEEEARVIGHMQPFVEVEGDAVGALQPLHHRLEFGRKRRQRPEGAVDMEPHVFGVRHVGEPVERVDRARVDRAGRADDEEGPETCGAVGGDRVSQRANSHRALFVGGDEAQMARAESRHLHRLTHAIMRLARGVGDELALAGAEPVEPHVLVSIRLVARDEQRQEIRHARPGDENAARVGGEAEGLRHPPRDLALDVDGDVIAPAAIGVHPRGEHFGDHAGRRPRALHPAHEHRMGVAGGVGQNEALEVPEHGGQFAALGGEVARKARPRLVGGGRPDRTLPHRAQIIDHGVERAMALCAEFIPIVGVEVDRLRHVRKLARRRSMGRRNPVATGRAGRFIS